MKDDPGVGQRPPAGRGALAVAVVLLVLTEGIWIVAMVAGAVSGWLEPEDALWSAAFLVLPVIAAAMAARRPDNPIGWSWLAGAFLFAMAVLLGEVPAENGTMEESTLAWLAVVSDAVTPIALILILFPATYLFPDGHLPGRRWRIPAVVTAVAALVGALGYLLRPTVDMTTGPALANPIGIEGTAWLDVVVEISATVLFVSLLLGAVSLIVRYRYSSGEIRLQLKWVAYVVIVALSGLALVVALEAAGLSTDWFDFVPLLVMGFGYPIAVGVAIVRYRLFAIDRLISRTVVYGVVVIVLAVVYALGAVWLPTRIVGEQSAPFVAGSTLAVAMAFNPLRRRVRSVVDRRFYRSRYEAEEVAAGFASRLRDQTDMDRIDTELTSVVTETLNPAGIGVWHRT